MSPYIIKTTTTTVSGDTCSVVKEEEEEKKNLKKEEKKKNLHIKKTILGTTKTFERCCKKQDHGHHGCKECLRARVSRKGSVHTNGGVVLDRISLGCFPPVAGYRLDAEGHEIVHKLGVGRTLLIDTCLCFTATLAIAACLGRMATHWKIG